MKCCSGKKEAACSEGNENVSRAQIINRFVRAGKIRRKTKLKVCISWPITRILCSQKEKLVSKTNRERMKDIRLSEKKMQKLLINYVQFGL